jgi:hypothetical protein
MWQLNPNPLRHPLYVMNEFHSYVCRMVLLCIILGRIEKIITQIIFALCVGLRKSVKGWLKCLEPEEISHTLERMPPQSELLESASGCLLLSPSCLSRRSDAIHLLNGLCPTNWLLCTVGPFKSRVPSWFLLLVQPVSQPQAMLQEEPENWIYGFCIREAGTMQ